MASPDFSGVQSTAAGPGMPGPPEPPGWACPVRCFARRGGRLAGRPPLLAKHRTGQAHPGGYGGPGIPGPAAVDWTPEKSGEAISILLSLYRDAALQSLGPEEAGRKLAKLRAGIPAGEGSFAQAPAQQPEPIRRDRQINISAADLAGKPEKGGPVLLEDFVLEECPTCERDSVIRAKGVSRCRFCGSPMIPCTACSSCSNPCPYGLSHGNFFLLKPDAKSVSAREAREWMALKRQQTDSLKRGRPRT